MLTTNELFTLFKSTQNVIPINETGEMIISPINDHRKQT